MSYIRGPNVRPPARRLYWWQAVIGLVPFEEDHTIEQATKRYLGVPMYTKSDYDKDVKAMGRVDIREAGAAAGAGAVDIDTVMLGYEECDRLLRRIRAFEREQQLIPTTWDYDGSRKRALETT